MDLISINALMLYHARKMRNFLNDTFSRFLLTQGYEFFTDFESSIINLPYTQTTIIFRVYNYYKFKLSSINWFLLEGLT